MTTTGKRRRGACDADEVYAHYRREVLLGLAYLTSRPTDVEHIVKTMEGVREQAKVVDGDAIDLLLCEIAFGDFGCPTGLARRLAQDAFDHIERGAWMPQRELLLGHVLDALSSIRLGDRVRNKVREWFPARSLTRTGLFSAMLGWPATPDVVQCLWKGVHDEDADNQRAAAGTLVELLGADPEVADRLESLVRETGEPSVQATALEILVKNWPRRKGLDGLLELARRSVSPELRLVSIIGRIRNGIHTEEDREELLYLGTSDAGLDFDRRDDVASALIEGWPGSPETKQVCFEALRERQHDVSRLEERLAYEVLLRGNPGDNGVARFVAERIQADKLALFPYSPAWNLLHKHFRDHPILVRTVDEWLQGNEQFKDRMAVAMAALVGRTAVAKSKLLSLLDSETTIQRELSWTVWALLEGWGMEDEEVSVTLLAMASGPVIAASRIGYFLPQILPDERKCYDRLIFLLRSRECDAPAQVLAGLRRLNNREGAAEVVDVVMESVLPRLNRDSLAYADVVANFILGFSGDRRVKEVARRELDERGGDSWSVARVYGDDEEIRRAIIQSANPLPTPLRNLIAERLGNTVEAEAFSPSQLALYDHESDVEVKTRASISYHTLLLQSGRETSEAVEKARAAVGSRRWDARNRVSAALCALLTLGKLEVLKDVDQHTTTELLWAISDGPSMHPNPPLVTHVLSHWDDMKAVFGEEFWKNLPHITGDPMEFWNLMSTSADEYMGPRAELLAFLEASTARVAKPGILRFLERIHAPNLLLDYYLQTLRIGAEGDCGGGEAAAVAAEGLGARFGGDEEILAIVTTGQEDRIYEKTILALSEGWPQSEELTRLFERVRQEQPRLHYTSYFRLLCRKADAVNVYDALLELLGRSERSNSLRNSLRSPSLVVNPLVRRAAEDESFAGMLMDHLVASPTESEKATLPRILSRSRGVTSKLTDWASEELERQLRGSDPPQIGVDLWVSEIRPVAHSLLEVLTHSRIASSTL